MKTDELFTNAGKIVGRTLRILSEELECHEDYEDGIGITLQLDWAASFNDGLCRALVEDLIGERELGIKLSLAHALSISLIERLENYAKRHDQSLSKEIV